MSVNHSTPLEIEFQRSQKPLQENTVNASRGKRLIEHLVNIDNAIEGGDLKLEILDLFVLKSNFDQLHLAKHKQDMLFFSYK
jgi:hypothetical protein